MKNPKLTHAAIGKLLGVSAAAVSYYKQQGCPIDAGDVDAIKAWKRDWDAKKLRQPSESANAAAAESEQIRSVKSKADIKYRVAKARREELRLQREEGQLIPLDDAVGVVTSLAARVKQLVGPLPRSVAPQLVGKRVPEIEAKLTKAVNRLLKQLADFDVAAELRTN